VRIRPQRSADEMLAPLIQDPWLVLPCDVTGSGCRAAFEDPEFPGVGRDTLYYVRAIQQATAAVNGAGLRCDRDAHGACLQPRLCFGDHRTPGDDDCLAPIEERAWSSPIYVDYGAPVKASTRSSSQG